MDFDATEHRAKDVAGTDRASFSRVMTSPDGRWLLLEHTEAGSIWLETLDLDDEANASPREVIRAAAGQPRFLDAAWGPSGSAAVLLGTGPSPRPAEVERAVLLELTTARVTAFEISHVATDAATRGQWSWSNRIAADGKSVVLASDGKLAVWRAGSASSALVSFDTSEWARVLASPTAPKR